MNNNTETNFLREVFIRKVEELCLQYRDYVDDPMDISALVKAHIEKGFNPIAHWKFHPIYTFDVGGVGYIRVKHSFKHHPIFYRNGYLLDVKTVSITNGVTTVSEAYELWLLDNMSFAVTYACNMIANRKFDDMKTSESATYRYSVKDGISKFFEDFDMDMFLLNIREKILTAMYPNETDDCIDDEDEDCKNCPNKEDCPFIERI